MQKIENHKIETRKRQNITQRWGSLGPETWKTINTSNISKNMNEMEMWEHYQSDLLTENRQEYLERWLNPEETEESTSEKFTLKQIQLYRQ